MRQHPARVVKPAVRGLSYNPADQHDQRHDDARQRADHPKMNNASATMLHRPAQRRQPNERRTAQRDTGDYPEVVRR